MITALNAHEDLAVVNVVQDAIAATEAAVTRRPDFVLLHADLPDLDDACRWINKGADAVRLVPLRSGDPSEAVPHGVSTGSAAVPEPCSLEEFLASVEALRDGGSALDPFAARIAIASFRRTERLGAQAGPRLNQREWEVLNLRAQGTMLREIARQFYISENTVKNHLLRIREKLLGMSAE